MDHVPPKVLNWLHSILLNGYRDVNRSYNDTGQALGRLPTIRPTTAVYTFDDGRSALLLHLSGTIPATFKGVTYSFPVSVWVPHEYPAWPPIAFVTAAQGMAIRPGQHVGVEGRFYHPYLNGWQPERSTILGLFQVLMDTFSREPPLVAKQNAPQVPPPPPSGGASRADSLRRDAHMASPGQLQPPARPPKADVSSTPQPDRTRSTPTNNQGGPPPRPPKPDDRPPNPYTALGQQRPVSVASTPPVPQHPYRRSSLSLGPGTGPQGQSWQQQQQQQQTRPNPYASQQQPATFGQASQQYQHSNYSQTWQRPPPQQQPQQQPLPQHALPPQQPVQQPRRVPEPQDLLTSPFDLPLPEASNLPVPPVPPNPEKDALLGAISVSLTAQLQSALQSNANALPALQAQHAALANAQNNLQQEFAHLRALEAQVQANEATLHASLAEADACIADAKQRPAPNVDETLIAPTVLSNQIYNLVAEEKSCVAAREVLLRALDRGRLGAEQWSRTSRNIAREEWSKKWLVRRAARGMGLQGTDASLVYGEKEVAA